MNLVLSCLFFSGLSYDTSIVKIGARSAKLKNFTPFVLISVDLALLITQFFAFLATVRRDGPPGNRRPALAVPSNRGTLSRDFKPPRNNLNDEVTVEFIFRDECRCQRQM